MRISETCFTLDLHFLIGRGVAMSPASYCRKYLKELRGDIAFEGLGARIYQSSSFRTSEPSSYTKAIITSDSDTSSAAIQLEYPPSMTV